MRVPTDELEVFVAVVEAGGFSAAARRLESTAAAKPSYKGPGVASGRPAAATNHTQHKPDRSGPALLPDFIVDEPIRQGGLVRILKVRERSPLTLSVLYPSRQQVPVKVRLFIDYLIEQLGR